MGDDVVVMRVKFSDLRAAPDVVIDGSTADFDLFSEPSGDVGEDGP